MNWKDPTTYVTITGIAVSALMAFGLLVPDEAAASTTAVSQLAGGIIGILGVIAAVRQRRAGTPPAAPRLHHPPRY